ncbi:MAG: hypothetical protein ABI039_12865 [Vicinamibacterales bacterium]
MLVPIIALALDTGVAGAQSDSTVAFRASNVRGIWASGAGGFADGDFFNTIGLHLQRGRVEISLRKDAVSPGGRDPTEAVGVLLGVAAPSATWWHAATSLGVSHSTRTAYSVAAQGRQRESAVGVMLAADIALRAGQRGGAGLGLTMATSRSDGLSYSAIALEVSLGRWR